MPSTIISRRILWNENIPEPETSKPSRCKTSRKKPKSKLVDRLLYRYGTVPAIFFPSGRPKKEAVVISQHRNA